MRCVANGVLDCSNRQIRPGFGMLSQKAAVIHVVDVIAGQDENKLGVVGFQ